MTIMVTIMARKRRSRNRRTKTGRRVASKKPPSVSSLVLWTIVFGVVALAVDSLLYLYVVDHHQKYGHWYLPVQGCVLAIMATGSAVSIPVFGVLARRRARR